ncbi:MAG TPA: DinB family protein [Pyrinomonadaceae bacterium]|jgi:hypothetical protein
MMTRAEFQSLADFLALTPTRVRQLTTDLSEQDARWKPSPQEFSALENICHLNDLEREGYAVRIEKLIGEEQPFLPDFDGGKIARERDYNQRQLAVMLDAFASSRESNLRAVSTLSPAELQRGGTLETVGPITLESLLLKMREHDEAHLQELSDLRARISRR